MKTEIKGKTETKSELKTEINRDKRQRNKRQKDIKNSTKETEIR